MTEHQEKLKKELLCITSYEEYNKVKDKFREIPFDLEVLKHVSNLAGPAYCPIGAEEIKAGVVCEGTLRKSIN